MQQPFLLMLRPLFLIPLARSFVTPSVPKMSSKLGVIGIVVQAEIEVDRMAEFLSLMETNAVNSRGSFALMF